MKLEEIINTDDAVAALTGLEEFEPIQIHLNGKNKYADLVDKLEEYLKNPDIEEINMFLKKYKFEKEFSKPDLLRIVLSANNFHLLTKFQFETTKDLIDVILKIRSTFLLTTVIYDYWSFSIQMSLKRPIISNLPKEEEKEEVNARDNGPDDDPVLKFDTKSSGQFSSSTPIKSPLVRSLSQPTSEESSVKRTKRTSGSPLKSEHRDNALKSYIGLLYPDSEVIDFPVNEFSDLKLKTIPSEGISRRLRFEVPSTYTEMDVQLAAQKNIFGIPSHYILRNTLTGGTRSITINENKLETRPDLEIELDKGLIPIEIKRDSIMKNLDYFYGKTSIRKRINFLEIYSQGVREALCCGINCFFLSDYTTTLFVEFNSVGEFQEIEGCTITRPLVGRIIRIEETKDSEYSANFHLFLLLKKLQNEYIQRSKILPDLQKYDCRDITVTCFYRVIDDINKVLFKMPQSTPFAAISGKLCTQYDNTSTINIVNSILSKNLPVDISPLFQNVD
ncbi:uncharacterized protein RJT21DRAFT_133132 [Scheffersomyces amazonensis]|uniref:uncharacterized protein n=1 Tax=Scheffersomyces amazonensis TaxID=1078765 RepID=UPI00315CB028